MKRAALCSQQFVSVLAEELKLYFDDWMNAGTPLQISSHQSVVTLHQVVVEALYFSDPYSAGRIRDLLCVRKCNTEAT